MMLPEGENVHKAAGACARSGAWQSSPAHIAARTKLGKRFFILCKNSVVAKKIKSRLAIFYEIRLLMPDFRACEASSMPALV
jgi:hypothetical protein